MHVESDPRAAVRVFYDGGCPICRREIAWYVGRRGADRIDWVDVSAADTIDGPPGLSVADLMKRFTVERRDGNAARGAAGFVALWRALPATALPGRLLDNRLTVWVGERIYRLFLRLRPTWRPDRPTAKIPAPKPHAAAVQGQMEER